jgi:hypothetical protein
MVDGIMDIGRNRTFAAPIQHELRAVGGKIFIAQLYIIKYINTVIFSVDIG